MHVDLHYTDPRLAAVYDAENSGRDDTNFYVALAVELGAGDVADVGCGTGVLACELAARGLHVTGVDPAAAMLDIARARPVADQVTWVEGTAADLDTGCYDLVVMNGHVAQVFVDDQQWRDVLGDLHRALRPGGTLSFESRNPAGRPWTSWTRASSFASFAAGDGHEAFDSWVEVTCVGDGVVELVGHTVFQPSGEHLVADSTLRFRSCDEIRDDLAAAGFRAPTVLGGWDRSPFESSSPEMIFVAERASV